MQKNLTISSILKIQHFTTFIKKEKKIKHLNKKINEKDHKHLFVIEVDLVEFDRIRTWRDKIRFTFYFKHNGSEACMF